METVAGVEPKGLLFSVALRSGSTNANVVRNSSTERETRKKQCRVDDDKKAGSALFTYPLLVGRAVGRSVLELKGKEIVIYRKS